MLEQEWQNHVATSNVRVPLQNGNRPHDNGHSQRKQNYVNILTPGIRPPYARVSLARARAYYGNGRAYYGRVVDRDSTRSSINFHLDLIHKVPVL